MRVARWSFVIAGILLAVVRYVGGSPAEHDLEGALASFAYGAAVAAPGVVALVARSWVVAAAAGIGGLVVAMVASFGVTLPLAIPALAIVASGLGDPARDRLTASTALAAAVVAFTLPWTVLVLLVHQDPVEWVSGSTIGSSSDIVVWWESLASLTLTLVAVALGLTTATAPAAEK